MAHSMAHVLIVDDDEATREVLEQVVTDEGLSVASTGSLRDAAVHIERKMPDALLADLQLPDGSGLELISKIDRACADVIVTTGYADVETAIDAMRFGVADYRSSRSTCATCGHCSPDCRQAAAGAMRRQSGGRAGAGVAGGAGGLRLHGGHLGSHAAHVRNHAPRRADRCQRAADRRERHRQGMVARTLHELSLQRGAPFPAVNCAAISPLLLESEFFGHERGALPVRIGGMMATSPSRGRNPVRMRSPKCRPSCRSRCCARWSPAPICEWAGSRSTARTFASFPRRTGIPCQAIAENRLRADLFHRLSVFPIMMPPLRGAATMW